MPPQVVQQVQPPHPQQIQPSPQPQVVPVRPPVSTPREGEEDEDEREQGPEDEMNKCTHCGKAYKHLNCLWKHRWEHSKYWKSATKFMLSKHQQVQMMEAAATLLGMDESREPDQDEIVSLFCKQRGHLAPSTSTASVSPPISAKSLSASPPQQHIHLQNMQMVPGPQHPGTRHSIASTVSSLSSTPPSLAPDDESVAEIEEEPHMGHFRPPMDMASDMKRQHGSQDMSVYPFPNAGGFPVYHQAHPSNSYHMH
ncbi:hypothetical protein BG006_007951 [Podila minutissima]|uniref:C2H2-type domain-containing protein n=1 Tax=Podila minutissima TaxID=64525 RepID=A0A9P5SUP0_9FUNG|nr:hypothetical protein BG006_007951 [Podila minutissima]